MKESRVMGNAERRRNVQCNYLLRIKAFVHLFEKSGGRIERGEERWRKMKEKRNFKHATQQ